MVPNKHGFYSPVYLVDCRSYKGFSGSPCFVEIAQATDPPNTAPYVTPGVPTDVQFTSLIYYQVLCGMFIGHYSDDDSTDVTSRYGVGVMLRGDEIRRALMAPEAIVERREWDRRGGRRPSVVPCRSPTIL